MFVSLSFVDCTLYGYQNGSLSMNYVVYEDFIMYMYQLVYVQYLLYAISPYFTLEVYTTRHLLVMKGTKLV